MSLLTDNAMIYRWTRWLKAAIMVTSLAVIGAGAQAKGVPEQLAQMPTVALADLPKQGREVYEKILSGGPFPYDKDGTVFGNRERLLPQEKRGYYREYTVKTPFSRDRGARRIVCGGLKPTAPEACYYTADHYSSFSRIVK
jgi:ribonuclease T1